MKNPEVYTATQVMEILQLGRSKAYALLDQAYRSGGKPFKVIKIGKSIRAVRVSFDAWFFEGVENIPAMQEETGVELLQREVS